MEEYEREVELIDYIEVLLKRRRLIIVGTVLCAVVTGLFVLSRPRLYEAQTLIAVSPVITSVGPGGQEEGSQEAPGTEIVVPSLAAETYEALAKGDELLAALRDSVLGAELDAEIVEQLSAMSLETMAGGMLEAELLAETVKAKSPLLAFRARSAIDALPVRIVNAWAGLFVKRNRGLSSDVAYDYFQWVQSQYDVAKEKLERTEDELREVGAAYNNLNVLGAEVNIKTRRLDSSLKDYQLAATKLEATQWELAHLREKLVAVELDGEWLGYAPIEVVQHPTRRLAAMPPARQMLVDLLLKLAQAENDSLKLAEAHEELWRNHYYRRERELLSFEQHTGSERLRNEVTYLDSLVRRFRAEQAEIENQIKELDIHLDVNLQNREAESPVLRVSKAITDQALWEEVTRGGGKIDKDAQEELGRYRLVTEELNPIHQALSATIRKLQIEHDEAVRNARFYGEEIPQLEQRLLKQRAHLDTLERPEKQLLQTLQRLRIQMANRIQQEARPVENRLRRDRAAMATHEADYDAMRIKADRLERDAIVLASDLGFGKGSFESWRAQIREKEAAVVSLRLRQTRLQRDLSVFQTTFTRFANLVEEARIAREQAAGDIQVVSRAVVARQVPREAVKKASIAGVVGLMASVMLAFLLEYVGMRRGSRAPANPV